MARILVTDDDTMLRSVVARTLAAAGHTIIEAANGSEAEAVLQDEPVDLVITDIIMPEMEGIELVRDLRRRWPDLHVIAMSGGGRTRTFAPLEAAAQFGAELILRKPFRRDELLQAVNSLLSGGGASVSGASS